MKKLLFFSFLICINFTYAQQKLKDADKLFKDMSYVDAAKAYEEYLEKEQNPSIQTLMNVGDTYYYLNDMRKAVTWYKKLYSVQGQNLNDVYLLRYTQALRGVRDYDDANKITKEYLKGKGDQDKIAGFARQQKYMDSLAGKPSLYKVVPLEINTSYSDFGSTFYGNQLVYSSSKKGGKLIKRLYSWNEQPFLSFYVADRNVATGALFNEQPFFSEVNSNYHDATLTFSPDLKTIYFTTNATRKNKNRLKNDKEGVNNFQILKGTIENGKVINIEKLFFNSLEYSVGHPSLSPDGKWLFFVSDMPGGYGETDIYVAEVFADGSINSPQNLGPVINTVGREMFPYYNDGVLYFSSDGHYGYGGLDVYESKHSGKLNFSEPKNVGQPVNSNKDDFSYIIDLESKYGYVSSNRDAGKGDDDIYYFTKAKAECNQFVSGRVTNSKSKIPIAGATVKVYDSFGDLKTETTTGEDGRYQLTVPCGATYKFEAAKENFASQEKPVVATAKNEEKQVVDFELAKLEDFTVKDGANEKIDINPIYFEYNKWNITPQAVVELDRVVYVMKTFPKVKIRIESHTDSRGSDSYNLKLSDNRAKATEKYILENGIAPDRILSAIGYGETRLKNKCRNGVKCTDAEHAINRRSDFIIVEK
ncbi:OmpA family protein [Flavobacterium inviolabile]|uniref:OmpA family protein n=1 Tax=Flavobacterium inviolabile TaxID=2748320 RepID=UPI0015AB27CC|nr:OmpA family protein [Flavobacterium inviolabile]